MRRIRACAALLVMGLAGCGGLKLDDFAGTKPEFRPERFFAGHTRAWGFFQDRFGTIRRQMVVDIDGTWNGQELVLDERFAYADGGKETRVWRIRKTGPDTYEGTAQGVVGTALGTARGQALNWRYQFDLPVEDSVWRVSFDDWMIQQTADVMVNRATVSRYGFTIGEVLLFFQRQPAPA